jgi:ABC-type transport system substrate-binding protein
MAIDIDTITDEVFLGYGKPLWTEFFRDPYKCDIPRPEYDITAAEALLVEAGWTDANGDGLRECHGCLNADEGYEMEIEIQFYAEYGEELEIAAQLIEESLEGIGFEITTTMVEGTLLWAPYADGGIELNGD